MEPGRYVWLDGQVQLATAASVPPDDRALTLADGLYETMRSFRGRIFRLAEHLERLAESLAWMGMSGDRHRWDAGTWHQRIAELLHANGLADRQVRVRIIVTRGSGGHVAPPEGITPRVLVTCHALEDGIDDREATGIAAWPVPYRRHPDLAAHKTVALLPSVLAYLEMRRRGGAPPDEPILTQPDGVLLEGATSNLFVLRNDGVLVTPASTLPILPGLTRAVVLTLMPEAREASISVDDLKEADEAFCTRSTRGVTPITHVGKAPIGAARPGPVVTDIRRRYAELVERELG